MCGFAPHGAASVMPGWAVSNIDRFKKSMRFCEILGLGAVSVTASFHVLHAPPGHRLSHVDIKIKIHTSGVRRAVVRKYQ